MLNHAYVVATPSYSYYIVCIFFFFSKAKSYFIHYSTALMVLQLQYNTEPLNHSKEKQKTPSAFEKPLLLCCSLFKSQSYYLNELIHTQNLLHRISGPFKMNNPDILIFTMHKNVSLYEFSLEKLEVNENTTCLSTNQLAQYIQKCTLKPNISCC